MRLRSEMEHVRPVGDAVPELLDEVIDRGPVGEIREMHLQAVAEMPDVVQRAARRRAHERMDDGTELDERVGEM